VPALLAEREEFKGLASASRPISTTTASAAAQSLAEADRASGRLAEALLPVLDAAEAAYIRHPDEVGPLLNQMLVELKKHGLETLDLENQPFDPELAEAVAHEPGEGGEPIVAEVLRSGYTWKGKVLRPAMVRTKD
jgi:molecular chaperone GrpE